MVYIPLFIDVSSLKVLVVGGGMVGSRRARSFLSAGAMVTVVAKELSEELLKDKAINAIEADIEEGGEIEKLIEQNDLIVIATDNKKINDKVYEMAKLKGKLINNATDA
ncbi:MAG: NAD-dependent epimerase/dehydratase family protein, partial [Caldisphaeraceae archaeon]|nr:NAD-dependent epimerase/dehydratase family protein [Caldisphaeraceae archaeon]